MKNKNPGHGRKSAVVVFDTVNRIMKDLRANVDASFRASEEKLGINISKAYGVPMPALRLGKAFLKSEFDASGSRNALYAIITNPARLTYSSPRLSLSFECSTIISLSYLMSYLFNHATTSSFFPTAAVIIKISESMDN